jgi:hypothetical protein
LSNFDAETEKDEQSELPEISDETADEEAETSERESEADETEEEEQCDCSPYAGRLLRR